MVNDCLKSKLTEFIDRHDLIAGNGIREVVPTENAPLLINDFISFFGEEIKHPRTIHEIARELSDYLDWDGTKLFTEMLFSNCPSNFNSILCNNISPNFEKKTAHLSRDTSFDSLLLRNGIKNGDVPQGLLAKIAREFATLIFYNPYKKPILEALLFDPSDGGESELAKYYTQTASSIPPPATPLHNESMPITEMTNPEYVEKIKSAAEYLARVDPRKADALLDMLQSGNINLLQGSAEYYGKFAYTDTYNGKKELYITKEAFDLTRFEFGYFNRTGSLLPQNNSEPFQAGVYTGELPARNDFKMLPAILSHELTHLDQMGDGEDARHGVCKELENQPGYRYDYITSLLIMKKEIPWDSMGKFAYQLGIEGLLDSYASTRVIMERDAELKAFIDVLLNETENETEINCLNHDVLMARWCFPNQWEGFERLLCKY